MPTYLVTGGAGFIGSHIAEALVGQGNDVRILDNISTGKAENFRAFEDKITFIEGDIRDTDAVDKAMKDVDYVFRQAALASVPRSINDPSSSNQVNAQGTLNALTAARDDANGSVDLGQLAMWDRDAFSDAGGGKPQPTGSMSGRRAKTASGNPSGSA